MDLFKKCTSDEWQIRFKTPKVLDPDGWDRQNFQYSWHEEHIDLHEYSRRVMLSTCQMNVPE